MREKSRPQEIADESLDEVSGGTSAFAAVKPRTSASLERLGSTVRKEGIRVAGVRKPGIRLDGIRIGGVEKD